MGDREGHVAPAAAAVVVPFADSTPRVARGQEASAGAAARAKLAPSRDASRGVPYETGYTDAQLSPKSEKQGNLSSTSEHSPTSPLSPPSTRPIQQSQDTAQPLPSMTKRDRPARNRLSSIMTRSLPSLRATSPPAAKFAASPLSPPLSAPTHRALPIPPPARRQASALPAIWGSDKVEEEGSEYLDALWGSSPPSSYGARSPTISSAMGVQRRPSAYQSAGAGAHAATSPPARPPVLRSVSSTSTLLTPQSAAPSTGLPALAPSVSPSAPPPTSRPAPPPAARTQSQPPPLATQAPRPIKPEPPLPSPVAAKSKSKGGSSFKKFLKRAFSSSAGSSSPTAARPSTAVGASTKAAQTPSISRNAPLQVQAGPVVPAVTSPALSSPPAVVPPNPALVSPSAAPPIASELSTATHARSPQEPASDVDPMSSIESTSASSAEPPAVNPETLILPSDIVKPERPTIVIPAIAPAAPITSASLQPVDPAAIPLPQTPVIEEDLPACSPSAAVGSALPVVLEDGGASSVVHENSVVVAAPTAADTTPADDVDLEDAMLDQATGDARADTSVAGSEPSTFEDCAQSGDGEVDGGSIVRGSSAGTASESALLTPADPFRVDQTGDVAIAGSEERDDPPEEVDAAQLGTGDDAADVRKSRSTMPRPISRGREALSPLVTQSVIEPFGGLALSTILAAEPVTMPVKHSRASDLDLLSAGMQRSASVPVESVLETAPISDEVPSGSAAASAIASAAAAAGASASPARSTASARSMSQSPTSSPSKSRFATALGLNRSATNSSWVASASPPKTTTTSPAGKRTSVIGLAAGPPPPAASARYRVPTGPGLARSSSKLRRSVVGLADILHPPTSPVEPVAPRQSLSPTMHTITSIHNEANAIMDKEEKELAESFFMY